MSIISGQGGGGSSGAFTSLFDSTLAAPAASIDTGAAGVSQAFNHLLIVLLARSTQAVGQANVNVTFNADAAGNYDRVNVTGASTGASASAATADSAATVLVAGGSIGSATVFGAAHLLIPAYRQTTADKQVLLLTGFADATASDGIVQGAMKHWRSTAAITQITATAASGNLAAGSRMTIYGLL